MSEGRAAEREVSRAESPRTRAPVYSRAHLSACMNEKIPLPAQAGRGISVLSELAVENEVKAGVLRSGAFTEGEILRRVDFIYTADGDQKFINEFIRFSRKRMGRSLIRVPGR